MTPEDKKKILHRLKTIHRLVGREETQKACEEIDNLCAMLQAVSEMDWIPASDPPVHNDTVLVCVEKETKERFVCLGFYESTGIIKWWHEAGISPAENKVIAWQEKPKPPEAKCTNS